MTLFLVLLLGMLFSPAVGPLFLPAVGPLFCHPSRCSGPQASSPVRRQSSVLVRASDFLSPASSSRVHLRVVWWSPSTTVSHLRALRVWRASSSRDLATRRRFLESSLAVIMALHEPSPHGTPWLSGVASREPLFSTSCLPVHVLTHAFSPARFSRARLLWHIVVLGGLLD